MSSFSPEGKAKLEQMQRENDLLREALVDLFQVKVFALTPEVMMGFLFGVLTGVECQKSYPALRDFFVDTFITLDLQKDFNDGVKELYLRWTAEGVIDA